MSKRKCECSYGYCCDHCWRRAAKDEPCTSAGCANPAGHTGVHGPLNNTGVISLSAADILGAITSLPIGKEQEAK